MIYLQTQYKSPHRIAVLHRIANPGPPGPAGSTPAVGVFIEPDGSPVGLEKIVRFFLGIFDSVPSFSKVKATPVISIPKSKHQPPTSPINVANNIKSNP